MLLLLIVLSFKLCFAENKYPIPSDTYKKAFDSSNKMLKLLQEKNFQKIYSNYVIKDTDKLPEIKYKQLKFVMLDKIKERDIDFTKFYIDISSGYYNPEGKYGNICFKTNTVSGEYIVFYVKNISPFDKADFIYYFK